MNSAKVPEWIERITGVERVNPSQVGVLDQAWILYRIDPSAARRLCFGRGAQTVQGVILPERGMESAKGMPEAQVEAWSSRAPDGELSVAHWEPYPTKG